MTANRKGISFTLTLVVIGVVLLMTALTVIVLGGGSIADFFSQVGESDLEATIQARCGQKANQINSNYCDMYSNSDCSDLRANPASGYSDLVRHNDNCGDWVEATDHIGGLLDELPEGVEADRQNTAVVTIQGDDYDCVQRGYMTPSCPA